MIMTDTLTREQRSWNMSRIKGTDTGPEILLRSLLHKEGFRFRIHDKRLPGRPDVVLPRYRTVIFINGCFWHRHAGCKYAYTPKSRQDFWLRKFQKTVQCDRKNDRLIRKLGWKVTRVWECKLGKDPVQVIQKITLNLRNAINED